jgi:hypothetical protein
MDCERSSCRQSLPTDVTLLGTTVTRMKMRYLEHLLALKNSQIVEERDTRPCIQR